MENIAKEPVQDVEPEMSGVRKFGKIGLDVGILGRWSRLLWGAAILLPLAFGAVGDLQSSGTSLLFYGLDGVYVVGISAVYVAVYWAFGERVFARANPWVNTAVFVGPAFVVAWWDFVFGPLTGLSLPTALPLAASVYIGISFILQWKIKYGGCEVVALPIILSKRRYTTYCLPLVALDAVEKVVVERVLPKQ